MKRTKGDLDMGKATQDLRNEHDTILHALHILERITQDNSKDDAFFLQFYDEFLYFSKAFIDGCHHGKEENYLFKELVQKGLAQKGDLIEEMLEEHQQGRDYIAQISDFLVQKQVQKLHDTALQYNALMRHHIDEENEMVFVDADRLINENEQNELFEKFEQFEEEVVGHGVHEKLHAMINTWEKAAEMA